MKIRLTARALADFDAIADTIQLHDPKSLAGSAKIFNGLFNYWASTRMPAALMRETGAASRSASSLL